MHVQWYALVAIFAAFPLVAIYAQSEISVDVEMDEYSIGENLVFVITVPDILENESATLTISHDIQSVNSVEILVPNMTSTYVSPVPIDSFYLPGLWTLHIEYDNMSASDVFTILDSDTILLPSWFKDITLLWKNGITLDVNYAESLFLLYNAKILDSPIPNEVKSATFPDWFKDIVTEWWIEGHIDDPTYVNIIDYLIPEIIILE